MADTLTTKLQDWQQTYSNLGLQKKMVERQLQVRGETLSESDINALNVKLVVIQREMYKQENLLNDYYDQTTKLAGDVQSLKSGDYSHLNNPNFAYYPDKVGELEQSLGTSSQEYQNALELKQTLSSNPVHTTTINGISYSPDPSTAFSSYDLNTSEGFLKFAKSQPDTLIDQVEDFAINMVGAKGVEKLIEQLPKEYTKFATQLFDSINLENLEVSPAKILRLAKEINTPDILNPDQSKFDFTVSQEPDLKKHDVELDVKADNHDAIETSTSYIAPTVNGSSPDVNEISVSSNQTNSTSNNKSETQQPQSQQATTTSQSQAENAALDKQLDAASEQEQYNNQLADENAFIKDSLASINAEENTQLDAQLDSASQEEDYLNQLDEENDFIKESLDSINAEEKSNKTIMDASSTTSQGFKQWMSLTTHEDWNDEQWEQQLIGSAIDTTSFAIGESFTTDGMQWTKVNEAFNNNLEGAGTSLVASQIINEGLGLKFGSGLDGQIANAVTTQVVTKTVDAAYQAIQAGQTLSEFGSSVSTNIGNMFYNAEAASQVSQAGNLKELGNVSQIGNLVGGIVGSYAAQQVLNSGTEAEVIGSAIGSTVGTILGSTFLCFLGPLGAAIGSYLGAAIGDTLGEKFNEYSEMDVGEIALDLINPISAVNLVGNFVSAVFGMDEKPPEPEAGVTLEYNPYTGVYEVVSTYEKNGGKTEGIEGASHSLSSSIQDTLNQIAGSGQIANRYDLPKIEVGYIGKHQYIKVNGQDVGKIDSQGMKNTIGTVLKDTVIEGGDTYVNRMVHNDQVSASDILSLVSSAKHLEAYDQDPGIKIAVDQMMSANLNDLNSYNANTAELNAINQQISDLQLKLQDEKPGFLEQSVSTAEVGSTHKLTPYEQDQQQLSVLQSKQAQLQSNLDDLLNTDAANREGGLKQAIEWQSYFNDTQSLNLQNPSALDDATRLEYEILHHNQLNANNPDQQFSLAQSDLSDLAFKQENGELTIYNRRGQSADTPLEDVPHMIISDWNNWSTTDSNMNLDFTNRDTNEPVEIKSNLHQLMVQMNGLDKSLNGETPDTTLTLDNVADQNLTVNIAKTVANMSNASGMEMDEQQALDKQFSGFGQQIDSKLSGLNGDDILLTNDATAQVDAGSGDDLIVESVAVTDNIGGAGSDTASYILSDEGVSVDLTTGQGHGGYAEGDTFDSIENAVGSHYNDQLIGSDDDNTLSGLEGNDLLSGGAGNDILLGGEGDDVLDGGAGKDHIDGGCGTDTLTFSDQEADGVHVSLNQTSVNGGEADGFANDGKNSDSLGGLENVLGTDGNDRVVGNEANNTLVGKAGDDRLDGMEGDDILSGGEGDDILSGGSGNDTLYGDAGDDILIGGEGDDTLYAGEGSDTLIGGQGNDTAILQGSVEDYALLNTINGSVTLQGPDNEITRLDGIEQVAFQQEDGTAVVTDMDTLLERLAQIDKEAREEQEDGGGVRTGINAAASAAFATSMVAALSAQAQELSNSEQVSEQQNQLFEDNTLFQTESSGLENTTSTSQQIDQMNALLGTEEAYEPVNNQISQTVATTSATNTTATASTEVTGDGVAADTDTVSTAQIGVETEASSVEGQAGSSVTPSSSSEEQGQSVVDAQTNTDAVSQDTSLDLDNTASGSDVITPFLVPLLTVQPATTLEDNSVSLVINLTGQNPNDETLEVYIDGVPSGAKLSAGTLLNDGRYLLQPKELSGLIFYPAENSGVDVSLDVTVLAKSISTGFAQSSRATLPVHVEPVVDQPILDANAQLPIENVVLGGVVNGSGVYAGSRGSDTIQTGDEDDTIYGNTYTHYPLTLTTGLTDLDGSESLTTRLVGLPTGTVILDSNNIPLNVKNGQYLTDFDVQSYLPVSIAVPTDTGAFSFDVVTKSEEALNGDETEVSKTLSLNTFDQTIGGDTIMAGGGNDEVHASIGNDVVKGELGDDTLYGNKGNDTLYGDAGNDLVYGEDGNDSLVGGAGNNKLYGGAGNDTLYTEGSDSVLDGGDGEDTLALSATQASQDLSGIKDIEHIQLNDNVQELKFQGEMDESLFIGQQTGASHKVKLIGTGTGSENVLKLDIGLQDFLTQLHSGSSAYQLTKNANGNDELVYEGKYYELEDVARLQFSSGYQGTDSLYLDSRNNNPFILDTDAAASGNYYEDGTSGFQNNNTFNMIDLSGVLKSKVYDIEDGTNVNVTNFSGNHLDTNYGNGAFYAEHNYNGKIDFSYSIQDSNGGSTSNSTYINLQSVDDAPIIDVTTQDYIRKYTAGFDPSDTSYTMYNFNIIDPDTSWENMQIHVDIASGGATKLKSHLSANKEYVSGLIGYDEFNDEFDYNHQNYWVTATDQSNNTYTAQGQLDYIRYGYNHNYVEYDDNYQPTYVSDYIGVNMYSAQTALNFITSGGVPVSRVNDVDTWNNTKNSRSLYDFSFNYLFNGEFKFGVQGYHDKGNLGSATPVILDLNENGFDLGSQVDFDFDADGQQETGNWLNDSGDAILAYDWNHDGLVNDASEIAFSEYDPNAKTDLEGLALAFDSNHDGVFDAQDEKWKDFGLWKDANLNGQTEEGEFVSMEQAGISSIQLTSDHQQEDGNGYTIFGKGAFTYQDGSEGSFADVALSYEKPAASVSGEPQQATDSVNQDQLDAQLNQLVSAMASNALSANEDVPLPVEETQNHDELLDTAHA
ncbi:hypothetical protein [Hydrogenovibrio sp. JE_KL2]|uniref:calcium-binding protein n=1 Tax=Hydrogenovibrio sp. JE_KL2 TaxID=2651188 RepID=UPI00128CDC7A|nr:hypothetical protein [Hydrogenovibrio sp. JE_KL2]MPQ75947.1 hypothetical protein [Hydrogenovibrio sp. JE_KL2]